ncbi:MAG: MFS transporter [Nocardioidaceae bacterium]|nr:MFS transporter [Nocardioidaceae bacterium]
MTDLASPDAPDEVAADLEPTSPRTRHAGWALVLICMAQLMVVLDSSIANIALPFIRDDLKIDPANLSWIVTGYALAFGGLLLLGGRLGDLFGRRRIFMTGVLIFAVASALGGVAQNEAMLLSSRGLQGLGAAMASPTALALITTTFPAGPQRNRAFSVFAAMSGIGAAIGLILGGWLTDLDPTWGWRLTFLINVPIGLSAAYLAPKLLPDTDHHAGTLDLPGAVLGTGGLLSLVFGITHTSNVDPNTVSAINPNGTSYGWTDPLAATSMIVGAVALIAFVIVESRVKNPLLPLAIFASRTRAVAFVTMMITPAAMFAMFFFLSLYVQNIMQYTPLRTGFAFLPFTFGIVLGATLSSRLISHINPRFIAGTGTILAGFALFGFSRLEFGQENYWSDIMPFVLLMSLGMGMTFVPMTLAAVHRVRTEDAGIGSGVLNTMQQVGGALGLATLSAVAAHFTTSTLGDLMTADPTNPLNGSEAFADGATHAFFVGALMIWGASLIVWLLLNVRHTEISESETPEGVHAG